jgi:ABC-2 type transport system ATP-binding protein
MVEAIKTLGLTKRYPRSNGYRALLSNLRNNREWVAALDAVDLDVREGETIGLLWPNGAGKTTLVKILCGLVLPSAGKALIFGHDVVTDEHWAKQFIGLVNAEERSFYWRLTGRENLEFFASLYHIPRRKARERIEELLELVGLGSHGDRRVLHYSTGMKHRLAIARGLLPEPRILLVDEPAKSLDPIGARQLRVLLKEKVGAAGRTVVLATHHIAEAEELCDRVAILDRGRLAAFGTVGELHRLFGDRMTYQIDVKNMAHGAETALSRIPGVVNWRVASRSNGSASLQVEFTEPKRTLSEVIRFMVQQGADIGHCGPIELPLEEVFKSAVKAAQEARS